MPRFLQTAQACADFYIERTPGARRAAQRLGRAEPRPALRELGRGHRRQRLLTWPADRRPARARLYRDYALRILDTLTEPEFLAVDTPGWEGILKHGMYHQRKGWAWTRA